MKDIKKIKKYSEALFRASSESKQDLRLIINNLNSFRFLLKEIPELRYLILSKRVSLKNKRSIIHNTFSQVLGDIELELIFILIDNNDASIFSDIIERFTSLVNSSSNVKKIHIISSSQYSDSDKGDIVKLIREKFNVDYASEATFGVDKTIIGGIKVRIGNKIIDGSVESKLQKIRKTLLSV